MLWLINPVWHSLIEYRRLVCIYAFTALKPVYADLSPVSLINIWLISWCLFLSSPMREREASQQCLTSDRQTGLSFTYLCLQQLHSTLCCFSQEKSWFHIMFLICHASVWADGLSIPDIRPRGDGSVGWRLLTGRGVDQLMAAVLYVQYMKADTESIADLVLYFIHHQDWLPLENNGSKYWQYNTILMTI